MLSAWIAERLKNVMTRCGKKLIFCGGVAAIWSKRLG